jgi:uncharacterized membrane protein YidH (DUF202 family)
VDSRHPLEPLFRDLAALRLYLAHYFAARSDAVKARLQTAALRAGLLLGAAATAIALVVIGVVFVALGVAHGLNVLFGTQWAGELVTGLLLLVGLASGVWASLHFLRVRSRKRIRREYERRREHERRTVGKDVAERTRT